MQPYISLIFYCLNCRYSGVYIMAMCVYTYSKTSQGKNKQIHRSYGKGRNQKVFGVVFG